MAFNSDGYIMIDFTDVDFRRTNQTIEGLYKRCVDVIGTNKFILVINANGRTPLPATCSFTNNQYVIDTCIYMFAISSNDNLFIRRNDVPASDIIDDNSISVNKTWSSNKIDSELDTKADSSALADYQPLLTPVSPISIENDEISVDLSSKQNVLTAVSPISIENDNISVDLSGKQDILTAGDNITIVNNIISATVIKSFTYTGEGNFINTIQFPNDVSMVLYIGGQGANSYVETVCNVVNGKSKSLTEVYYADPVVGGSPAFYRSPISWTHNTLTVTGNSAGTALNQTDSVYTVYYI